jgi:hypothetical protein
LKNSICLSRFFAFSFDIGFDNRLPFSLNTTYLSPTFLIMAQLDEIKKFARGARAEVGRGTNPGRFNLFFALAQTKTTNYSLVVVMPSCPLMMMFTDPVGTVFVPPIAGMPLMTGVPIAVGAAPITMILGPFGVMPIDPAGMVFMPPIGIVPRMMIVPVTIMLGMCDHRRHREERGQCCTGEKCSKFHSWYLLVKGDEKRI